MNKLSDIENMLKEKGYKLTAQRRIIIEAFDECPAHYNAYEIFEKVKAKNPTINFSTVYRNLQLLCSLNIIRRLNITSGAAYFELKHDENQHHVVCLGCGEMQSIEFCPYIEANKSKLKEIGFVPVEHRFEIYGYCKKCSKDN